MLKERFRTFITDQAPYVYRNGSFQREHVDPSDQPTAYKLAFKYTSDKIGFTPVLVLKTVPNQPISYKWIRKSYGAGEFRTNPILIMKVAAEMRKGYYKDFVYRHFVVPCERILTNPITFEGINELYRLFCGGFASPDIMHKLLFPRNGRSVATNPSVCFKNIRTVIRLSYATFYSSMDDGNTWTFENTVNCIMNALRGEIRNPSGICVV